MISNEHIQVLQRLLNNGYISPDATNIDIQDLLDNGHTLTQLKDVTEEQARIAQQVMDTGEPFSAQTVEGPINMQPDEAADYLNEALRIWLGVMYWSNVFEPINNPQVLRMIEQYDAGLTNQADETPNLPEQDTAILNIPEDDLVAIRDRLFDSTHPGALNAVLYWLETTDLNTLERLIERYSGDGLPAGNYARGLSNEYWGEVLDAFTSFYTGRGVSLTAEALRAGLDQLVELVRLRMPEDEADNHNAEDDDLDEDMLEDMAEQIALEYEEEPISGVALYRQLLDDGYDTLDILVDWYLGDSRQSTFSRIFDLDYSSVIDMFDGLEEYQRDNYIGNNPEDPDLIDFDIHITPETLTEYLNHMISLEAPNEEDTQKPRTINSIIMKGW